MKTIDQDCAPTTPREIDPVVVSEMLLEGTGRLVDVREADERRRQFISGSLSMPLSSFDAERLDCGGKPITILHCHGGGRSRKALERLEAAGKLSVAHMRGGIDAWKAAGLPIVEERRAPLSAMQQTQIFMGMLVLVGTIAGAFWSPWALVLSGLIGCGMIYAGLTGSCAMANLLGAMPWNRSAAVSCKV